MNAPVYMRIAVARISNDQGEVLLVRKRNTLAFMQPGGKIEAGEDALVALVREVEEELTIVIDPKSAKYLGEVEAPAANEEGVILSASVFCFPYNGGIEVDSEIAEAVWIDPTDPGGLYLAPLTRDHILSWSQKDD